MLPVGFLVVTSTVDDIFKKRVVSACMLSMNNGRIRGFGDKSAKAQFHFADVMRGKIFSRS